MAQATRSKADHRTKTCTHPDGCTNPLRARGLCSGHYNRATMQPRTVPCAGCGKLIVKTYVKTTRQYICSLECRTYVLHGARSCPVPSSHASRSTPVPDDHPSRVVVHCAVPINHPSRKPRRPAFHAGLCIECGKGFVVASEYVGTAVKYCSMACTRRVAKRARRARETGASGSFTWDAFVKLTIKLGNVCAYCGTDNDGRPFQPDHVVPLSRHGHDGLANILPACAPCNGSKGSKLTREWMQWQPPGSPPRRFDVLRFPHLTAVDHERHYIA